MRLRILAVLAVLAACSAAPANAAAILDSILTGGENTLKDADGEWVTPNPSLAHPALLVGDTLTEVLNILNITNGAYNQTPVTTATGLAHYQLSAVDTITVTGISEVHVNGSGVLVGDISFLGTSSINETKDTSVTGNAIDFTTQSRATLLTNAGPTTGTNILTLSLTAFAEDVPLLFSSFPVSSSKAIAASFGLDVTTNPGMVPVIPLAETSLVGTGVGPAGDGDATFVPFDVAGTENGYTNTGANSANVTFLSNTDLAFFATPAPEPATCLIWAGLGGFALLARRLRRGNEASA